MVSTQARIKRPLKNQKPKARQTALKLSLENGGGAKKVNDWDDKNNRSKRMLERNVFPWLGNKPITDILPKDILACLWRVEDRGTIETAHRTLQICGQVFRYAVATSRVDRDITPDLRGALPPAKGDHFAAITEPKQVAELLRAIDSYQGSLSAISAKTCPHGICKTW